jgi:predicted dehydrogenase
LAAHPDLDSALAAAPEATVVCTPAHLHVEIATRLAAEGIHLLIEKPLSVALDGVEQLKQFVAQKKLVAAVAYVSRAHPVLTEMRKALASGRFGRPLQTVAVSGQHFPFYRPAYREIYYNDRATGGGAIQDALTHVVNAVEWLIGPMTEVTADAAQSM